MTNCDECRWSWNNACKITRQNEGCYNCPNFDDEKANCKCTILLGEDEEVDCPYFENFYGGSRR